MNYHVFKSTRAIFLFSLYKVIEEGYMRAAFHQTFNYYLLVIVIFSAVLGYKNR